MTPFSSQKVWTQALAIGAAATCRLTKIYVTAVACIRSYLGKRDGLGLEAIMQVRKEHKLPEVHFAPGNPAGKIAGSAGDSETRAYILKRRSKLERTS